MVSAGALIFGALLSLFGSLAGLAVSQKNDVDNMNAVREENAIEREREDTTFQRKKEDAIQAGYSPLSVVNAGVNPARVNVPQSMDPVGLGLQNLGASMSGAFANMATGTSNAMNAETDAQYKQDLVKIEHNKITFEYDKLNAEQRSFAFKLAQDKELAELASNTQKDIASAQRALAEKLAYAQMNHEKAMAKDKHDYTQLEIAKMTEGKLREIQATYTQQSKLAEQQYQYDKSLVWQRTAGQAINTTINAVGNIGAGFLNPMNMMRGGLNPYGMGLPY